jgi:hypothetical protein
VILLGHRTNLDRAKAQGERSMFGKAGCGETAEPHAGRGPDGKVKAALLEPQCPLSKPLITDTAGNIRGFLALGRRWPGQEDAPRKQGRL